MVQSSLSPDEVKTKANLFFSKNYKLVSQTDTQFVYENGKDIDAIILIIGVLFLLIGAILYYFLAKTHSVTVIVSERANGSNVEVISTTQKSLTDGNAFLASL